MGAWPAIWMLGYQPPIWPRCGSIDIVNVKLANGVPKVRWWYHHGIPDNSYGHHGVSRPIYVNVDTPNLGFPYFNFLGGYQLKKTPCTYIKLSLLDLIPQTNLKLCPLTHMQKHKNYKWLHKQDVQLPRLHLARDARFAN